MTTFKKKYDVAIIGGGPGGSATATYLRKLGHSVVVFEKEKFPRQHIGESLIPYCYNKLKELEVLDQIKKFATLKPGINFVNHDGKHQSYWCFQKVLKDDSGVSFHTLRAPFDKALLDNAGRFGAEVYEEHRIKDVDLSNANEVEITGTNAGGENFSCKARFLVDASGQGSFLARKFGSKKPYKGLERVAFFTHWRNNHYDNALQEGLIKLIYLEGKKLGWLWVIPVGPDNLSVGVSVQNEYVKKRKKELEEQGHKDNWIHEFYMAELKEASAMEPILKDAHMEHEVISLSDYSYYNETKFGQNYAMVGDAGAFLDPIFSSGIYVALESACLASKAIDVQLREGMEKGQKVMEETYTQINDGYMLIEKFVRLFYTPEVMNFSFLGSSDQPRTYENWMDAYSIFHLLLSGDFFVHSKKHADFIDSLKNEKAFRRFVDFYKTRGNKDVFVDTCGYTYKDIYGHITEEYSWPEKEGTAKGF
jgi:hypothetical protein